MQARGVTDSQLVQSLWSGYGQLVRMHLQDSAIAPTVIVKQITPPDAQTANRRGWSGEIAHNRKLRSYQVETSWYRTWSPRCTPECRVPRCYAARPQATGEVILLEDLDAAGYHIRTQRLSDRRIHACLRWLANLHALFMHAQPDGLWPTGTYWHLETRPEEWAAMDESRLKHAAAEIDRKLNESQFQTIVHGDAKVANFCFAADEDQVAAVDFQYVGGGCGMKDVAYLMGSCLSEPECESREHEWLDVYFAELRRGLDQSLAASVESEWRELFPWAWADFHRFLEGWCATHPKLTGYSKRMVERVLLDL